MRYVYLVRHGQYDHDDTTDSRTGKALVALGHEQARLAGERLAGLPIPITTPAHGTAFDIASRGIARADGLAQAYRTACRMALAGGRD